MISNRLAALPPAIAALTSLTGLYLSRNVIRYHLSSGCICIYLNIRLLYYYINI